MNKFTDYPELRARVEAGQDVLVCDRHGDRLLTQDGDHAVETTEGPGYVAMALPRRGASHALIEQARDSLLRAIDSLVQDAYCRDLVAEEIRFQMDALAALARGCGVECGLHPTWWPNDNPRGKVQ